MNVSATKKEKKWSWFKNYRYRVNVYNTEDDGVTAHLCFGLPEIRERFGLANTTINRMLNGTTILKYAHIIESIERIKIPAYDMVMKPRVLVN
tara:strand:+ start:218 stop:496 length:279 start_codon:yes stop_codon:yes gene_type:complete